MAWARLIDAVQALTGRRVRPGVAVDGVMHFKLLESGLIRMDKHENTWMEGRFRLSGQSWCWEIPVGVDEGHARLAILALGEAHGWFEEQP